MNFTLVLDRTYKFINGTTIPYSTYLTYSLIDNAFVNLLQFLN